MRSPLPSTFLIAFALLAGSCGSEGRPATTKPGGMEETAGEGGTGGTGGNGGSPGTGGAGPRTDRDASAATGGTGGSGGSGGSGGAGADDAGSPVPAADGGGDAPVSVARDGGRDGLRPWIEPCAPEWTRAQCCMHYCACMMKNCAERLPPSCVETCTAPGNNWNLKCRVEQCFESTNPNNTKDRASHCGHAVEKPLKCQGLIP
jgi:hypothetical protein